MGITVSPIALTKGLRTLFMQKAIESAPPMLPVLATAAPSNSNQEDYGWLGDVPQVREWLNDRVIKGLSEAQYTLVNRKWESTIGFKAEDIEDDINGMFDKRISQLARRATNHPFSLLIQTIVDGVTAGLGEDLTGQTFFNNAHTARGEQTATQDNIIAQTGTTVAAITADYISAKAALDRFVDEANEPFRETLGQLTILYPPELDVNMHIVFDSQLVAAGGTNVLDQAVVLHSESRLANTSDWYLLHTGGEIKPFLFQDRVALSFMAKEANSDQAFLNDLFLYGTRARYNTGYGLWQEAVKVV